MSSWIGSNPVVYPALEVLHVAGIAMLVGNLVLFESRVLGFGRELAVPALARLALRIALVGFGLAATTGVLMFSSQPGELIANRAFVLKMVLLVLAGSNAALFHARGGIERLDRLARAQTVLSLGLWLGVMICGRWIAYR